ncbi:MAG TPA: hypothetical protein VK658_15560 [Chryseolinea sp.]|nr:hypothetical protein [Chryseolinea sp.]
MKREDLLSEAEIADIVFNSDDAELNDLLCYSQGKHDFNGIFRNICLRINATHSDMLLFGLDDSKARREFLREKIKRELMFYATAPLKKDIGATVEK